MPFRSTGPGSAIPEIAASSSSAESKGKSKLGVALRIAVSALLLGYVFWRADLSEIGSTIQQTDPLFMTLSFLIAPVLVGVSCWRWSQLLKAVGIHAPFIHLFILYKIGSFFSQVLPTNVGGDVIRAGALARSTNRQSESVASIFIERYTGLAALVVMALISVPFNLDMSRDPRVLGAVALATGGYLILLVLIMNPRYIPWLKGFRLPKIVRKFFAKVESFQSAVNVYRNYPAVLIQALLISVLWNIVAVLNVYLSARAFGGEVSFGVLLVTVPLVLTIAMVPISLGGIGLAEWAYMFAFTQIGAGAALGLSVALLLRVKSIIWGVVLGGGFFAIGYTGGTPRVTGNVQPSPPTIEPVATPEGD